MEWNTDSLLELLPPKQTKHCQWNSCKQIFNSDQDCYKHVKTEHVIKGAGKCLWNNCLYNGKIPGNISNHLKSHFNVYEGLCLICKIGFKYKFDLNKHLKSYHKDEADSKMIHIDGNLLTISYDQAQSTSSHTSIDKLLNN